MRLINTYTCSLERFTFPNVPEYAILSHVWGAEEVSFEDFNANTASAKPGYEKIRSSVAQAKKDGHKHLWIDTVCIDQSSSAELSEAINSMFKWYKSAATCYVYLEDVQHLPELGKSRWFTRGWTLQELVAPKVVTFFNRDWDFLGSRTQLKDAISAITRIPTEVLEGQDLKRSSIAQRMSWAASRKTTRVEDMAYSLLGIFDINMPLLYGEGGEKAFLRLQEEIARKSDDQSIFAWKLERRYAVHGLFAPSPAAFAESSDIIPCPNHGPATPFTMTNRGLRIQLPLSQHPRSDMYAGALSCMDKRTENRLGIYLVPLGGGRFIRTRLDQLPKLGLNRSARGFKPFEDKTIYVPQRPFTPEAPLRRFQFRGRGAVDAGEPNLPCTKFRDTGQALMAIGSMCLQCPARRIPLQHFRRLYYFALPK